MSYSANASEYYAQPEQGIPRQEMHNHIHGAASSNEYQQSWEAYSRQADEFPNTTFDQHACGVPLSYEVVYNHLREHARAQAIDEPRFTPSAPAPIVSSGTAARHDGRYDSYEAEANYAGKYDETSVTDRYIVESTTSRGGMDYYFGGAEPLYYSGYEQEQSSRSLQAWNPPEYATSSVNDASGPSNGSGYRYLSDDRRMSAQSYHVPVTHGQQYIPTSSYSELRGYDGKDVSLPPVTPAQATSSKTHSLVYVGPHRPVKDEDLPPPLVVPSQRRELSRYQVPAVSTRKPHHVSDAQYRAVPQPLPQSITTSLPYPISEPPANPVFQPTYGPSYENTIPLQPEATPSTLNDPRSPLPTNARYADYEFPVFRDSPPQDWTAASSQSILKLNTIKKNSEKKQTMACLFCRERKIACGRPAEGSADTTCNQCARRQFKCEYPKESRRGQHKRTRRKTHDHDVNESL